MTAAERHYPDTSRAPEPSSPTIPTWCGRQVPHEQTTTIRRRVTCPECRAAAGIADQQ